MIAKPYLIALIVATVLLGAIIFLANGVTPDRETVVDVIEAPSGR